ncbi:MAG: serine hydrolase domain-containing protein [Vicinamibacterales bacterium]
MRSRMVAAAFGLALVTTPALLSQVPRPSKDALPAPEAVGFSRERLGRVDTLMQEAVDGNRIAGAVTMIVRRGRVVHAKAYGMQDREANVPMKLDTIFRVASMTKTPTGIAVMMLMEEGRLLVSDPVSKFIPAFRKTTVAVPPPAGSPAGTPFTVVPAKREITIHDLLTKQAGMGYPPRFLAETYAPLELQSFYFAHKAEPMSAVIDKLAKLPFTSQPGEKYENGFATDGLGVVIEKVSGMSLDQFFKTRIFDPLKMTDTSFYLPKEKAGRLAVVYAAQPGGGIKRADGKGSQGQGDYIDGPRVAFSSGGGLLSTASDYLKLVQVLVNGGELNGVRLLSPKTVQLMLTNHVGSSYENPGFGTLGFGYGFELTLDIAKSPHLGSPGDFGYRSAYFTRYMGDPAEQLSAVFLAQLSNYGGTSDLHYKWRSAVYQAMVESTAGARR